jgi:hypothetical protein
MWPAGRHPNPGNRFVKRTLLLLLPLLVVLPSAGNAQSAGNARDWLDRAVRSWNTTRSFHFDLELQGRTIGLGGSNVLTFSQVRGNVVAPNRMRAETVVRTPLGNAQIGFVAIDQDQWMTNPLSRAWEKAPPEMQTDVGGLFDPNGGIGSLIAGLQELRRGDDQTVRGAGMVRLHGALPGAVLASFAPDLATVPRVDVEATVGRDDALIHRIVIREPARGGVTPTWTFSFTRHNEEITIRPPL